MPGQVFIGTELSGGSTTELRLEDRTPHLVVESIDPVSGFRSAGLRRGDQIIAIVDFKAILAGKAADVRLEAHDMVYVPFSPYRTLERYAKLITDTFVRTVAANEGGRAARPTFEGIGVSNPITP